MYIYVFMYVCVYTYIYVYVHPLATLYSYTGCYVCICYT